MSRPATIPEALAATVERGQGEYVFYLEDGVACMSCGDLLERAEYGARSLTALGVEPGDRVGVLGSNRPEWVVWAFATWLAGATLVPVQIPLRVRDRDAFRDRMRMLVEASGCRWVMAERRFLPLLPAGIGVPWEDPDLAASGEELPMPAAGDAAVIQFTSGSTAAPKGALLTHAAVMAQMDILRPVHTEAGGAPRAILSWAPFFHDLGLVANLILPSVWGNLSRQLPTDRFAADPAEWLRLVERSRCTMTVGPSSAFGSAMRSAQRRGEGPDLSSLEVALFAAEGVDPDVARRLTEADFGLRPEALGSTYGLAESVLAAAYSSTGSGLGLDRVSMDELVAAGVASPASGGPERVLVSCGPPRMEMRIQGEGGVLPERNVGEVFLRGESLMSGYVSDDAADPFVNGWLPTGDLGYMADGELFVTGRIKDLVISMGHNYYPEDFEWAAARVDGVRPGRCVAFNIPATEEVALLVEAHENIASRRLSRDVGRAVGNAVGVRPSEVVVVPPGTVQKTTSGKLCRAAMRDAFARGELAGATA